MILLTSDSASLANVRRYFWFTQIIVNSWTLCASKIDLNSLSDEASSYMDHAELGTWGIFKLFINKKWFFCIFIKLIWLGVGFLNRIGAEIDY